MCVPTKSARKPGGRVLVDLSNSSSNNSSNKCEDGAEEVSFKAKPRKFVASSSDEDDEVGRAGHKYTFIIH